MLIFSDLGSKYDLLGMKIKSYHYVPSSEQTEEQEKSVGDDLAHLESEQPEEGAEAEAEAENECEA
eukprot:CAMPEP_0185593424 /NCGR_PEP_ID=MMETSP0434-20130131/71403_1 /TAXON_ID=626734 ORGANISM="Favella taraikaensis, Strain Fe Narragansett Bay" /NCGR_SAMPLE_ID=MMETSP0434 /ASSEMBLY_ACC=CAM_ASM_000379 /LENGTH=65 /DNA_ID=CAMNT_0028219987 /DNA_START=1300 /DNA_END=1497 /DNA_ORIENTATION=+